MDRPLAFIGIDPGVSGGLSVVTSDGTVASAPMPTTPRDIYEWLGFHGDVPGSWNWGDQTKIVSASCVRAVAVIEKVGGFVKGNPSPGSAMFTFGRSVGVLVGLLTALKIPFEEIHPRKWQGALGIPPRGKDETKTAFKNRLKQKAQGLVPHLKHTLGTCDAVLLSVFCQRKHTGTL